MREAGHTFLARMGKKRLRPGGKLATEWLLDKGSFGPATSVLEVACNMGTTAIELVKRFDCTVVACDIDPAALEKAEKNVQSAKLAEKITLLHADATSLPFENATFDVVLNEAMLTMLPLSRKEKAVSEYFRVLKPGGLLLTHDVLLTVSDPEEQRRIYSELSGAINSPVVPLTREKWEGLFTGAGFAHTESLTGPMSLMSLSGMIYDEGLCNTIRVIFRSLASADRKMFLNMRKVFSQRASQLGFIAACSRK